MVDEKRYADYKAKREGYLRGAKAAHDWMKGSARVAFKKQLTGFSMREAGWSDVGMTGSNQLYEVTYQGDKYEVEISPEDRSPLEFMEDEYTVHHSCPCTRDQERGNFREYTSGWRDLVWIELNDSIAQRMKYYRKSNYGRHAAFLAAVQEGKRRLDFIEEVYNDGHQECIVSVSGPNGFDESCGGISWEDDEIESYVWEMLP